MDVNEEVTLSAIASLFRGSWKIILATGLLGLAISCIYLLTTPRQFEAGASFAIARVSPTGELIEKPQELVSRLRLKESYSSSVLGACVLSGKDFSSYTSVIRIAQNSTIDEVGFTIIRPTLDEAKGCFNAVTDSLVDSQLQLKSEKIELLNRRSREINKIVAEDKDLLGRVGPSSPAYFEIVQEIRNLEKEHLAISNQLDLLTNQGSISVMHPTPTYSVIGPKKILTITIGLLGGIFFGLVIALGFGMYAKYKSEVTSK